MRNVNVEGELLVEDFEHLVFAIAGHEIQARTDVELGARRFKFEGKGITASGDAIGPAVVCTIQCAIGCASGAVSTNGGVPLVSGVAIGIATLKYNQQATSTR